MSPFNAVAAAPSAPIVAGFANRILASCLDIKAIWSIGHPPSEPWNDAEPRRLLVFGDAAVLLRLQNYDLLHDERVELLVVTDGNAFASAWGPSRLSGSLARWAWRQSSAKEAFYEESCWAEHQASGAVVRVRRKAFLLWRAD